MTLKLITILALLSVSPTIVRASSINDSGYEEVSYDDLVSELNSKKSAYEDKIKNPPKVFRLGVGFVRSYEQMHFSGANSDRSQSGLELSMGTNLTAPNLYAEGLFRNFSGSTQAREDLQVQQFDARLGYLNDLSGLWKYNLVSGFSGRFIEASGLSHSSVNEFSPAFTAGFGILAELQKNLRIGVELAGRTAILGRNTDKDSVDIAFRLQTSL